MKFAYADSLDCVDPKYDFIRDRHNPDRQPYWDDVYPHEILNVPPYNALMVSRGIVGDRGGGKYTETQAQRFCRVGAREFLRATADRFKHLEIFGDCGAFTYSKETVPPYTPEDMLAFYDDSGFDYGCSVDHIIFDLESIDKGLAGGSDEAHRRFDLTLANAEAFLAASKHLSNRFTPMGVIQGWSPGSMGIAAANLIAMGYRYLAVGGMVPLRIEQIRNCLAAIRIEIDRELNERKYIDARTIKLHLLGFGKADHLIDHIDEFRDYGVASFDTASPMIRAFKDARSNYYLRDANGRLSYYTAIRVPQVDDSPKLRDLVKQGRFRTEDLRQLEHRSLSLLRAYDGRVADLNETLDAILDYSVPALYGELVDEKRRIKRRQLAERYERTLMDRPWDKCSCAICRAIGIEVIIFRASNRNKRRGMHNLATFHNRIQELNQPAHLAKEAS